MEQLVVDQNRISPGREVHGTGAQFELYALHRLPEADLALLEEHLLICAECRKKLDETGDFALGMREASRTESAPAGPTGRPGHGLSGGLSSFIRRPAVSMALAFVAVLALIGMFSNGRTKLAPSASLQLTAMRGAMPLTVPANVFDLTLADAPREGGPFRVEVLNAAGGPVWSGLADSSPGGVHFQLAERRPLPQGDYFVRLYSPAGTTLREYGFRIRP